MSTANVSDGYNQNNTANNEENKDLSCATCACIAYGRRRTRQAGEELSGRRHAPPKRDYHLRRRLGVWRLAMLWREKRGNTQCKQPC